MKSQRAATGMRKDDRRKHPFAGGRRGEGGHEMIDHTSDSITIDKQVHVAEFFNDFADDFDFDDAGSLGNQEQMAASNG